MEKDYKKMFEDSEWEIERMRDEQRRDRENERQRVNDERRERQAAWAESQCYADSWEEAFSKGIPRFQSEANGEQIAGDDTLFFTEQVKQCEFAKKAYDEAMAEVRAKIKELEAQALINAAEKVEAQFGDTHISTALREDDWRFLVEW